MLKLWQSSSISVIASYAFGQRGLVLLQQISKQFYKKKVPLWLHLFLAKRKIRFSKMSCRRDNISLGDHQITKFGLSAEKINDIILMETPHLKFKSIES